MDTFCTWLRPSRCRQTQKAPARSVTGTLGGSRGQSTAMWRLIRTPSARVIALFPALSVFFTLWESTCYRSWNDLSVHCFAGHRQPIFLQYRSRMESSSGRPLAPLPKILVAGAPIGEVHRQHAPLEPLFRRSSYRSTAGLGRRRTDSSVLRAKVAGIGMRHAYPSLGNSLNLTYFKDRQQRPVESFWTSCSN